MAKKTSTGGAASTGASTKSRKKAVVRKDSDLMGSTKGKVYLVVRKAFAVADKNNFSGTSRSGKKFPNGVLYSKGKDGGSYWLLDENGAEFKDIRDKAKKALGELTQDTPKYGEGVKALVDAFSNSSGTGRSGSGTNMSSLKGLSL